MGKNRKKINFDDLFPNDYRIDGILKFICYDSAIKEIGDRVKILNYASITFQDGKKLNKSEIEELKRRDYLIVIEAKQDVMNNTSKMDVLHDLVIEALKSLDYPIAIEFKQDVMGNTSKMDELQDLVVVDSKRNRFYRINSHHVKVVEL